MGEENYFPTGENSKKRGKAQKKKEGVREFFWDGKKGSYDCLRLGVFVKLSLTVTHTWKR